jgi:hypothetical protein
LPTWLAFGHPNLPCISLWKPQVCIAFGKPQFFFPPHLCRWLFWLCWLGTLLANLACLWAPQLALHFPLETPSFHCIRETPSFFPITPVSLALSVMLVGSSSCQLDLPLDAPLSNLPCIASGNPKFILWLPCGTLHLLYGLEKFFVAQEVCRRPFGFVIFRHFVQGVM